MRRDRMESLAALAALRTEKVTGRLARLQTAIDAIERKSDALRAPQADAPLSIPDAVMRDRWDRWRSEQLRVLGEQNARLYAAAQPLREARARDRARQRIVEKLITRGPR